jgi:ligand-binding sensor domain-containing protein
MACETLRDHNGWMVAVAAVVLLAWNSVDAAEPATTFTHLGAEDGLPSPTVWAVAQDSRGFMWFGTSSGLARYDGLEMLVYRHDPQDPRSLIHDDISALLVDRAGTLWVGTAAGLSRYDPGTDSFNRFVHDPTNPDSLAGNLVTARSGLVPTGSIGSTPTRGTSQGTNTILTIRQVCRMTLYGRFMSMEPVGFGSARMAAG